jgi:cytoskeletal protein RodZ
LKKSEHKRAEPKLGEPKLVHPDSTSEITIAQELHGESVADTLIRARQQVGQDLRSIADVLCIRYSYLDAIERGQYENLPGPTYAMGFVRTYAEYLGLDGDNVVDRFKNEVEGLDSQTKLHFPTPAPEGKMPGGAVFLVAALLFAGAYGVWFYLSNQGESLGDLVAPVPEQLQEMVDGATSTAENAAPAPASPAPAVAPSSPAPSASAPSASDPSASAESVAAQPATLPQATAPVTTRPSASPEGTPAIAAASPPAGPAPAVEPRSNAAPAVASVVPQATSPQTAAQNASQPPVTTPSGVVLRTPNSPAAPSQSGSQTSLPPAPAESEAPASEPMATQQAATPPSGQPATGNDAYAIPTAPDSNTPATAFLLNHEPTVYGEENGDARIVLKATQDAWVQVRDRQGNLLLTRVLRVGDSYMVPNQADLTLLTGNAGGLEVSVDGSALPALGPVGAVRRNIPLDPDALRDGAGRQP